MSLNLIKNLPLSVIGFRLSCLICTLLCVKSSIKAAPLRFNMATARCGISSRALARTQVQRVRGKGTEEKEMTGRRRKLHKEEIQE
jgi:hypothetical protein